MLKQLGVRLSILAIFVASPLISLQAKPTEIDLTVKLTISEGKIIKVFHTINDRAFPAPKPAETGLGGGATQDAVKPIKTGEEFPSRVPKNSIIHLTIEEDHQPALSTEYDIEDHIRIEWDNAELAANKPNILTEPYFRPFEQKTNEIKPILNMESDLLLDLAGRRYSLKISWYKSLDDKLRGKEPAVIYEGHFSTYHVYYVGLNAGWLFPLNKNFYSYSLYHTDPADGSDGSLQTLRRTRYYQTKAILFASIYPWGIEPEAPLSWKNTQLNLGTELSSSIMKSLYVGVGYDFRFFSVNLFYGITKASVLPDEYANYANQTIANKKITSLTLLEKWDKFAGLAISFPFSLAAIFGKLIGL